MKKEKIRHLLGEMGGSVQKGLIPYTRCGRRTGFSSGLITNVHQDGHLANCSTCVKLALVDLETEVAWRKAKIDEYQRDVDVLMMAWRRYAGGKPIVASEF